MAATTITFFPVDNGDMTLIKLGDKAETRFMIDCNIREAADDPQDAIRDVAADLRSRLKRDSKGRPYLDAFLLTHPDADHCRGLKRHFYLGPLTSYPDDNKPDSEKRIVIGEIWSSPIVFRRASREHVLCEDAIAFNTEAKRRVKACRDNGFSVPNGDRILVLGEDEGGKTDDLGPILVKVNETVIKVNGVDMTCFAAQLLAPLPGIEEEMEEELTKNHSSVVINVYLAGDESSTTIRNFLTGGDAEVAIWEMLWEEHRNNPAALAYDLLLTPHHCSWHSLSRDSWSELHEAAEVSAEARASLSQMRDNGVVVASSCPIENDDNDPPCYGAKLEYEAIATEVKGKFYCTGEYPKRGEVEPLEFLVTDLGMELKTRTKVSVARSLLGRTASSAGLVFPNKPVIPNKPAGFA